MFRAFAYCILFYTQLCLSAAGSSPALATDLHGNAVDPWKMPGGIQVLLFVRTDCPITNRYAPELQRIANRYKNAGVRFWLVYSGRTDVLSSVEEHLHQYAFPGTPLLDPEHALVSRAHAAVAPEAAVFDRKGQLLYHGRIDDRWISFGRSRPAATVHDLDVAIESALAGRTPPKRATQAIGCSLVDEH